MGLTSVFGDICVDVQVKRIARRYKTQYDELKKATGNQSKQPEPAEGEAAGSAAAAAGAEPLTAEPTLSADGSSHEAKIKELTEKVESLQGEVKKAQEANEQKEVSHGAMASSDVLYSEWGIQVTERITSRRNRWEVGWCLV